MTADAVPSPGFADPTSDAQRAFRAVLDALARPGWAFPLTAGPADPPPVLGPGLGAVALTLLDDSSTAWLGGDLGPDAKTASWLAFHTGVRLTDDPAEADFLLTGPGTLPRLDSLALGTDEAPHLSATVIVDVRGCDGPARFTASGPGINGTAEIAAPWAPGWFAAAWQANHEIFPRGADLVLVDTAAVTALPRTTRLTAVTEPAVTEPAVTEPAAGQE